MPSKLTPISPPVTGGLLAAVCLGALIAVAAKGDDPAYAFWANLLRGPVKSAAWAPDPKDPAPVASAKTLLREGFGELLERSAWEPGDKNLTLQPLGKADPKSIVIGRYASGDIQYIGLIAAAPTQRIRLRFPGGKYQYELIENRFAGEATGAGIELEPNRVHWLAVFPYQVNGMSLTAEPRRTTPGGTVTAQIRLTGTSPPELHCFRVLANDPQSKPLPGFPQYVMAPEGKAAVKVALPAAARPGVYGISARCVVTAAIAADTIIVGPEREAKPAAAPGG